MAKLQLMRCGLPDREVTVQARPCRVNAVLGADSCRDAHCFQLKQEDLRTTLPEATQRV